MEITQRKQMKARYYNPDLLACIFYYLREPLHSINQLADLPSSLDLVP